MELQQISVNNIATVLHTCERQRPKRVYPLLGHDSEGPYITRQTSIVPPPPSPPTTTKSTSDYILTGKQQQKKKAPPDAVMGVFYRNKFPEEAILVDPLTGTRTRMKMSFVAFCCI